LYPLLEGVDDCGGHVYRQTMTDKRTALRAASDKALESILTKEQLAKYAAKPRGGRGGGGWGGQ